MNYELNYYIFKNLKEQNHTFKKLRNKYQTTLIFEEQKCNLSKPAKDFSHHTLTKVADM